MMKEEIWFEFKFKRVRIYVECVVIYMNEIYESWSHKLGMLYEY